GSRCSTGCWTSGGASTKRLTRCSKRRSRPEGRNHETGTDESGTAGPVHSLAQADVAAGQDGRYRGGNPLESGVAGGRSGRRTGAGTASRGNERDSEAARSSDDRRQPVPRSAREGSDQSGVVSALLVHGAGHCR